MKITKKRIYNLKNNLPKELFNNIIIPAVVLNTIADKKIILDLGFSENMNIGETVLPRANGPVSIFNSEGKEVPDKTKPKETRYREIEWCWNQWIGRGKTERICDFTLVPYKRWPRNFINPPSVQLTISKKDGNQISITTQKVKLIDENRDDIIHKINLLLELFGYCEILDEKQVPIIEATKNLNWTILPQGKRPWKEQKKLLKPLLDFVTDRRSNPVIQSRLEDINSLDPEFTAIGNQGFSGYVIFGFPAKNIYIFESAFYGNAIYIFNENWESLSKKTKAEILNANLQIARITHNGEKIDWLKKIRFILK